MTRLEKMADINEMAKFLDKVVQDCDLCPCMEDGICEGHCKSCVKNFKEYLSKEYKED